MLTHSSTRISHAPFIIRRARSDERAALKSFVFKTHLDASSYSADTLQAQISDLPDDFPSLYDDTKFSANKYWLIESDEAGTDSAVEVAGCIGIKLLVAQSVCIENLFVHPKFRRRGIASALLRVALDEVAKSGIDRVELLTLRGVYGDACKLYESIGFRVFKEMRMTHYVGLMYELTGLLHRGASEALTVRTTTAACDTVDASKDSEDVPAALLAWQAAGPPPWDWPGRAEAINIASSAE
jgi:GNAT superfamily N-acetyltransferase